LELSIPRLHTAHNTGKSYLLFIHINISTPFHPVVSFTYKHCAPRDIGFGNLETAKRNLLHFINADGNVIDLPNNGILLTNFLPGLLFLLQPRVDNKQPLPTVHRLPTHKHDRALTGKALTPAGA